MSEQPGPRRAPRWAVAVVAVGAVLMVLAGGVLVAVEWALARYEGAIEQRDLFGGINEPADERYGEDIEGPLNILLVGLDTRPSRPHEAPRADAIMILHINEDLDQGYMISLPRDLIVEIPPYPPTGYSGGVERINAAMFRGSQQLPGEELPDVGRGFELLAATVSDVTGIDYFHAGVVINFEGFTDVVDAMGGITLEIEEQIVSLHRQPDGKHRKVNPAGGYLGPRMVYEPGVWELEGWQALDIARQRYGVEGADYGRHHNQQKVLRAILDKALSREIITDPIALDRVLRAAGESLIFDGRGHRPIDFAFALSGLRPGLLQMITLPGASVGSGDNYQGEELAPEAYELFAAAREDRLDSFMLANPQFLRAP